MRKTSSAQVSQTTLRREMAIGVDGCPGGWLMAVYRPGNGLAFEVVPSVGAIIGKYPAVAIGIDIPIGLADDEPRGCDLAARKLLGAPRASSVFPAPARGLLHRGLSYPELCDESRRLTGRGISKQTYHIIPKIEDVDREMSPALDSSVIEVHPEMCFWTMAGRRPMFFPKRSQAGYLERRDVLRVALDGADAEAVPETRSKARALALGAEADDVLDAIAAVWSALRFARGEATVIPDDPQRDRTGLLMRMVC